MATTFDRYAAYYDLLYRDKDYEAECDLIERLLAEFSAGQPVVRILDVGCGTGGHAGPLARRGYRVVGVDSSPGMLAVARERCAGIDPGPGFVESDMRALELGERFDAAICMFAALGYQLENEDVAAALASVRRHLEPGGLFVFDVWNGLAVLRVLPEQRLKTAESGATRVLRLVRPALEEARHLCHDRYHLLALEEGCLVEEVEETHTMRFFFPQEIAYFLTQAGFQTLRICPFPDVDRTLDSSEAAWNVAVIAQAGEPP